MPACSSLCSWAPLKAQARGALEHHPGEPQGRPLSCWHARSTSGDDVRRSILFHAESLWCISMHTMGNIKCIFHAINIIVFEGASHKLYSQAILGLPKSLLALAKFLSILRALLLPPPTRVLSAELLLYYLLDLELSMIYAVSFAQSLQQHTLVSAL
jgi:hypothetical protein